VIDCLSSSVYGNKRSEIHFLDIEGVYVLLDLIETCEESLKRVSLASLCTILENSKSFQYFIEWNSTRTSLNATQLLIKLYQQEDTRYGVKYSVDGILESAERPLVPGESYLKRKYKSVERGGAADEGNQSQLSMGNSPVSSGEMGGPDVPRSRHSNRSNTTNSRSIISNDRAIHLSSSKASKGLKKALEAAK
jgi:hypothetical protein